MRVTIRPRFFIRTYFLMAVVGVGLLIPPAFPANTPSVRVHRVSGKIQVDGILNEAVWAENPLIANLTQVEPNPGQPPTEPTEVRLAYNNDALYIAIRCKDSQPQHIVATEMARDSRLYGNDHVDILLDTYHDRRSAYYFATNPVGALVDGRIAESRFVQLQWDGMWYVRTRIDEEGWTAEFEIPFKTLGFRPGLSTWGFNVGRYLARRREESRWASPSLDVRFFNVARAGVIEGLEGLSQGIGLDVKSYGVVGFDRDTLWANPVRRAGDAGVDIFYRITSNLVSATTFNTDFAETEVDARRVNLTRFSLFFPEKRAFFLEDAGVFSFASGGGGGRGGGGGGGPGGGSGGGGGGGGCSPGRLPFLSRTIGLYRGREVPVLFGEKLTGTVGRFDVGFLAVRTGELRDDSGELLTPVTDFTVGRVKTKFWRQSYIGALFTNGSPAGKDNRLLGADLQLATSNLFGRGKNANFSLFAARTRSEGLRGRDGAFGGGFSYPNDFLTIFHRWLKIEDNFNPALGFVPRRGVAISSSHFEIGPRPRFWNLRQVTFGASRSAYQNLTHRASETQRIRFTALEVLFNSGDRFAYDFAPTFERLFSPWEIRHGVVLPAGKYWFNMHSLDFRSSPSRRFSFGAELETGAFYSGNRHQLSADLTWRKDRHLSTSLGVEENWVRLKEGDFNTRLIQYRLDYSFTPLIGLANFLQYDTDSRNLGLQSRLRWILKPGNEIHLVINHAWQEEFLDRHAATQTRARFKLNYTLRF